MGTDDDLRGVVRRPRRLTGMVAVLLAASGAWAAAPARYDLDVTAVSGNLFRVAARDLYIYTERCPSVVAARVAASAPAAPASAARSRSSQGMLQLADGRSCAVKGVYGRHALANDRYGVSVAYRSRNWYEAVGTEMFLRTRNCMRMTLSEKGVLVVLAQDDQKLLFPDGSSCEVEAVYARVKS